MRPRKASREPWWNWNWKDKTIWDLSKDFAVPALLALGVFHLQDAAKKQELKIANDQVKQEILTKYFDQTSALLLDRKLRSAKPGNEVRVIARARTLSALRNLDGGRKGDLVQFLSEANLIQQDLLHQEKESVIELDDADLAEAKLTGVKLIKVRMIGANLSKAYLVAAKLTKANLAVVKLNEASLYGADLVETDLAHADLSRATLERANLSKANLTEVDLRGANLSKATLKGANLSKAKLDFLDFAIFQNSYLCETTMPDDTKSNRDCNKPVPEL
ncbi:pentapeptide repeat-containing protein [Leptolyngbya sp. FACHB-17]|uniref:pentapeptide repeat-containing protein n=1 Tax=unclassified Leptolyngbya TaxID=2650499 RepID=UPI001680296F|nr:pentapeptide repeat-containing protein [Leptolyngbya sp. FACHB-17]MBD2082209.1 pentapeptide repeat-containing protein [Leptolyngbya sp. FACHB-17]